jgi:hypothetical protein
MSGGYKVDLETLNERAHIAIDSYKKGIVTIGHSKQVGIDSDLFMDLVKGNDLLFILIKKESDSYPFKATFNYKGIEYFSMLTHEEATNLGGVPLHAAN